MAVIELRVLICGEQAGTLLQDEQGAVSFRYDDAYQGVPLSLGIPISNRRYGPRAIVPYLFGLLPDDERQRISIARQFGVRPNNPVALLACIGKDCPGAVQFCAPGDVRDVLARPATYEPLRDADIAARLRDLRRDVEASWLGSNEHWSLGGNQGKFALAWHDGAWCSAQGAAPTTHIVKNGVAGFRLQALNEFVCMKTAERCGIPAAQVSYRFFEDEPALIVQRYDRVLDDSGVCHRIHQEDCCQALGVMPQEKYTADGGPTARDVVALLSRTSEARVNVRSFTRMLFFNALIGGTDAHAKNYSILLGRGGTAMLAPLYDVASGLAYDRLRMHGRLAMSIGGENRIGSGALERYARMEPLAALGLGIDACWTIMHDMATELPQALASTFEAYADLPGMAELRSRLEGPISEVCRQTLALL